MRPPEQFNIFSLPPIEPTEMQGFLSQGVVFHRIEGPTQLDPSSGHEVAVFNVRARNESQRPSFMNLFVYSSGIEVIMTNAPAMSYQTRMIDFRRETDQPAQAIVTVGTPLGDDQTRLLENPDAATKNFLEILRAQLAENVAATAKYQPYNSLYLQQALDTVDMASHRIPGREMNGFQADKKGTILTLFKEDANNKRKKSYIVISQPYGVVLQTVEGASQDIIVIGKDGTPMHYRENQIPEPLNLLQPQSREQIATARRAAFIVSTILRPNILPRLLPFLTEADIPTLATEAEILKRFLADYTYRGKRYDALLS